MNSSFRLFRALRTRIFCGLLVGLLSIGTTTILAAGVATYFDKSSQLRMSRANAGVLLVAMHTSGNAISASAQGTASRVVPDATIWRHALEMADTYLHQEKPPGGPDLLNSSATSESVYRLTGQNSQDNSLSVIGSGGSSAPEDVSLVRLPSRESEECQLLQRAKGCA